MTCFLFILFQDLASRLGFVVKTSTTSSSTLGDPNLDRIHLKKLINRNIVCLFKLLLLQIVYLEFFACPCRIFTVFRLLLAGRFIYKLSTEIKLKWVSPLAVFNLAKHSPAEQTRFLEWIEGERFHDVCGFTTRITLKQPPTSSTVPLERNICTWHLKSPISRHFWGIPR